MNQNLRQKYKETVVPMLMEQFKYKNIHEVPKITKITINQDWVMLLKIIKHWKALYVKWQQSQDKDLS